MSEEPESDRKEAIKEKTLERRFDRRSERRTHRLETIIPEDRFTKTADYVNAILTGEIIANRMGLPPSIIMRDDEEPRLFGDRTPIIERRDRERRKITPGKDHPQTQIIDLTDHTIKLMFVIIDSLTRGICPEIVIKSPSTNFSLTVILDGRKQFGRTYDKFVEISPQSDLIDAYTAFDDSLYVLGIGEISWKKECKVVLSVTEEIVFNNIWVNLKEFVV